jgi:sialidase-1
MRFIGRACIVAAVVAAASLGKPSEGVAIDKLVDTVMLPHDPDGVVEWCSGTTLSLDGQNRLMMLVQANYGGHDESPSDILRFDSTDGGLHWTPLGQAQVFQANIGVNCVEAPSLLRLSSTKLLCFFGVNNSALWDDGPWMKQSLDNGASWSSPVRLPYEGYGAPISDGAILCSTGRVVLPSWVSFDRLGSDYAYCFYSDDQGQNWQKSPYMTTPKGSVGRSTDPAAEEPTVIELSDHRLMMLIRTYLGSFYKSYSSDFGAHWTTPVDSGIMAPGAMPRLSRMPDGDILLLYNSATSEDEINGAFPRKYLSAAVSEDEGVHFSPFQLLDGGTDFPGKITMANVTFFNDNAIITYSKSADLTNSYDWRLQVIPQGWFIEAPEPTAVSLLITGLCALASYRWITMRETSR